jgi:hypothetical protein
MWSWVLSPTPQYNKTKPNQTKPITIFVVGGLNLLFIPTVKLNMKSSLELKTIKVMSLPEDCIVSSFAY